MVSTFIRNIKVLNNDDFYNADSLMTPVSYKNNYVVYLNGNRYSTSFNSEGQPCRGSDMMILTNGLGDLSSCVLSSSIRKVDMLRPEYGSGNIHSISCCVRNESGYHAFISDELSFDENGNIYKDRTGDGYSHISMVHSKSPIMTGSRILNTYDPLMWHWQSLEYVKKQPNGANRYTREVIYDNIGEIVFQYPAGVQGLTSPDIILVDGIFYMFYTRFVDLRRMNWNPAFYDSYGYPPNITKNNNQFLQIAGANICVATSTDLVNWKKYYEGPSENRFIFDYELNGYLDTCVMPIPSLFGKIHWNTYYNRFIYICQSYNRGKLTLLSSENLFDGWRVEQELPFENAYYPNILNEEGNNDKIIGKNFIITYCVKMIDQPNYTRMNWVLAEGEWL